METTNKEQQSCENNDRRKALKAIIGGTTAVAAYNLLPAKWNAPLIESVFVPAHAALSGGKKTNTGQNAGKNGGKKGGNTAPPNTNERSIAGDWKVTFQGVEGWAVFRFTDKEMSVVDADTETKKNKTWLKFKGKKVSYTRSGNTIKLGMFGVNKVGSILTLSDDGNTMTGNDIFGEGKGNKATLKRM